MVIRLSRGTSPPALRAEVALWLEASAGTLIPAILALPGCLSYYAGADEASCSMVNISVWDTAEHAEAMSTLGPMLDLGQAFTRLGVQSERPPP